MTNYTYPSMTLPAFRGGIAVEPAELGNLMHSFYQHIERRAFDIVHPRTELASRFRFKKVGINTPIWKIYKLWGLPKNKYSYNFKDSKIQVLEYKKPLVDKCNCQLQVQVLNGRSFYIKINFRDIEKNKCHFVQENLFKLLGQDVSEELREKMFSLIKGKKQFTCCTKDVFIYIENNFNMKVHILNYCKSIDEITA